MSLHRLNILAFAALFAGGLSLGASAQTTLNPRAMAQIPARNPLTAEQESGALLEGMGVLDRARPEYDAVGVPLSGMTLYPTLASDVTADDNIFRSPGATVSDTIWTISPRLDLRSNWDSHALQLYGQLDHYDYQDRGSETRTNWMLGGVGRLDIASGGFLKNATSYFDTHEARTSPDLSLLAASPTRYRRIHTDGLLSGQFSAFTLSAAVNYDRFDFDATDLIGGGLIDNGDRDRNVYQLTGKAAYELAPDQSLFVQFTYDLRDFDRQLDRNGFDRNSDGYRVDFGASLMLTPLIRGTAYAGLLQQNYAAPLHDVTAMDFHVEIDWFATELLTAHLRASRIIDDTTVSGASSTDVRRIGASVDYELLRPLILQPHFDYYEANFTGIARDDRVTSAGLEARYSFNGNIAAYAGYNYQHRATSAVGRDYSDNLFTAGLRGQL
ncbi:MAG TPA: outer membrane beta-barrel protein [Rhizomicrobium sp.]|nr:outer membrane beta-barrel protein [Rhizomicrobium sp.]